MQVAIETSGCAHNRADGETLAAVLELNGHTVVEDPAAADVVVLNTCTVKDNSFRAFEQRLAVLEGQARRVVVAGCIPSADPSHARWGGRVVVGVNNLTDIALAVEAAAAETGGHAFLDGGATRDRLALPSRRAAASDIGASRPILGESVLEGASVTALRQGARPDSVATPVIEVVPIAQGCLSSCSFCETRLARGRLVSYPVGAIVDRIRRALDAGVKEIWLTSQDSGAYGRDAGRRLADLLEAVAALPGAFRVRLGMANPQFLLDQIDAVAAALASPSFFRFLHLPLQSGSEAVLRRMRRGHTAADWVSLCETMKAKVPGLTLATDVIVGFPGETDSDFEATLSLLGRIRPAVVNRSKFSPRPRTEAAGLEPKTAGPVVKARSSRLDGLVRALSGESLSGFAGCKVECLVDQCRKPGSVLGRTASYRPVAIPVEDAGAGAALLGRFVEVRIVETGTWHLTAERLGSRGGSSRP